MISQVQVNPVSSLTPGYLTGKTSCCSSIDGSRADLVAGTAYPIYASFSENAGGDYLAVAFKLSSSSSFIGERDRLVNSNAGKFSDGYGYYFNGTPNTGINLTGPVTLNNNVTINSQNSTVQINGSVSDAGTSRNLTINTGSSFLSNINITGAVTADQVALTSRNASLGGDLNLTTSASIEVTGAPTNTTSLFSSSVGSTTIAGGIKGTGVTLTKTGAGSLTMNGQSTYTGNTTISAGSLIIGSSGSLNSGDYSANISNAGSFIYSSSADQILGGVISGAGSLTKNTSSSSILTLSGINTYTGNTTVSSGSLLLTGKIYCANASCNQEQSPAAITTVQSGATLEFKNWMFYGSFGSNYFNSAYLVIDGGTLKYSGLTDSATGRGFTVGANGATFENATEGTNWGLDFLQQLPIKLCGMDQ